MESLTITTVQDEKDLSYLLKFMDKQPQSYPKYRDWVHGKCQYRIEQGVYHPIIVFSEKKVVGDGIYTFLENGDIEIKNFRIDKNYRNRALGYFILKQIEFETHSDMTLDVSVDNFLGVEFFIRNNFKIIEMANLYFRDREEYIMKRKYSDN